MYQQYINPKYVLKNSKQFRVSKHHKGNSEDSSISTTYIPLNSTIDVITRPTTS